MSSNLYNEVSKALAEAPVELVRAVGLRLGLRALPLVTLGQPWSAEQRYGLVRLLQTLQFVWTSYSYGRSRVTGWNDERIEQLGNLWDQGRTATEIARFLGGVSRNAVIGKAHRLGLQSRPKAARELFRDVREEGPFFEGEAQNLASLAILRSVASANLHEGQGEFIANEAVRAALEEILEASEAIRTLYPTLTPDRILIPTLVDLDRLRGGLSPAGLSQTRLWPANLSLPIKPSFPTGRGWSFWRKWYDARRFGRHLDRYSMHISAEIEQRIAALPNDLWHNGADAVNYEIDRIMHDYDIEVKKRELPLNDEVTDPSSLGNIEPQTASAATFVASTGGDIIDVDVSAQSDSVDDTADARDRHKETLDSAEDILQLYERFSIGGNQVVPLVQQVSRLKEAMGTGPRDVRPGLLIPRGERLRQKLSAQDVQDEIGAEPPLPHQFITNLRILVAAYNVFVALDPILARYDEARLPPELANRLVPPALGTQLIHDAVARSVAADQVEVVLAEEAQVAPPEPDATRRESRRYSESIRNFVRVALERAFTPLKLMWKHRERVVKIGQAVGKFARWISAHGEALMTLFPTGSATHNIIRFVVDIARKFS